MTDLTSAQRYAKGLLTEECGETVQAIGKADRFGIDTPGPPGPPYDGRNARQLIEIECGDVLAAIDYACMSGLLDRGQINLAHERKLAKLLDENSRDNLGRRLAPDPFAESR